MTAKKIIIILSVLIVAAAVGVGGWFLYDNTVDRSGWEDNGNLRQYLDFHGNPVTGWQQIDGHGYYFFEDTAMATGWQEIGGSRYYFGTDGIMATSWLEVNGSIYCFDETGKNLTGWQEIEGKRYYLPQGILATGWQEIEGSRYYFADDGVMTTGTVALEGKTYTFAEDGKLATGWRSGKYYLSDGTIATGWQEIEGKRYCFDESGNPKTGWLEEGEYRYYLLCDGSAAVGPYEIDGYTYHFTPKGIQIWLVNGDHLVPDFYVCDKVLTSGGVYVDKSCAEAFAAMFKACQDAGNVPHALVGYRSYWDQKWMVEDTIKHVGYGGLLYVAQPNASEHQLGLAVDVIESGGSTVLNNSQENTGTFKWFQEHCWEYGFILRYLNGTSEITGVGYEPWHYRYVGVEVAMELKDLGITLEEYLGAA